MEIYRGNVLGIMYRWKYVGIVYKWDNTGMKPRYRHEKYVRHATGWPSK